MFKSLNILFDELNIMCEHADGRYLGFLGCTGTSASLCGWVARFDGDADRRPPPSQA